jgi:hypothetical protein
MILAENGGSVVGAVISLVWIVAFIVGMAFILRWQVRVFRDVQTNMKRIADAIERIADR